MNIRPLEWRDLPTLFGYRHQSVYMDSSLLLTRGPMIMQGALKSYLGSTTGVFTYISNLNTEEYSQLIGQVMVAQDAQLAHLTFLTPQQSLSSPAVTDLLEYLVFASGENGAHHLMAEVEEWTPAYEALRRTNFSVYTRQRIWKLDPSQSAHFIQIWYPKWCGMLSQIQPRTRTGWCFTARASWQLMWS
jgi:hypothetical protein